MRKTAPWRHLRDGLPGQPRLPRQYFWYFNPATQTITLSATRDIDAGSEILIEYTNSIPQRADRQLFLVAFYGFQCKCSLCEATPAEVRQSDWQRGKIHSLRSGLANTSRHFSEPEACLSECYLLQQLIGKEFEGTQNADDLAAQLFETAYKICITHSD